MLNHQLLVPDSPDRQTCSSTTQVSSFSEVGIQFFVFVHNIYPNESICFLLFLLFYATVAVDHTVLFLLIFLLLLLWLLLLLLPLLSRWFCCRSSCRCCYCYFFLILLLCLRLFLLLFMSLSFFKSL